MKALMIDIETLSLRPTAAVTQIGFCAADLRTGEHLLQPENVFVDCSSPAGTSVHIDQKTVGWWMRQSEAARAAVFPEIVDRVAPPQVWELLREVYRKLGGEEAGVTVWASPAMFDLPILTNLFWGALKPWPYNMERDLMTLYKMLDPEKLLKPTNPIEHDAASDAKAQMDHLIAIFQHNQHILKGAK